MTIPPRPRRQSAKSELRSQQKEDTKIRLLDAAERWFSVEGYEKVSVTEVARTAGVVPSLINAYFGGKAGLLYAVVERHNAPQFAALARVREAAGSPPERLDRVVAAMAGMDLQRARLLAALQGLSWTWPPEIEAKNLADLRPFFDTLAELVHAGIEDGSFRAVAVDDAVAVIWAVYTMGLRPAVFGHTTPEACVARIQTLLRAFLLRVPEDASPA